MSTIEIVFGVILILFSLLIILVVLFQEGHQNSSGVITGGSNDTFLTKNKSRSIDSFLERWTKVIAIGFFFIVIAVNAVMYFKLFGS